MLGLMGDRSFSRGATNSQTPFYIRALIEEMTVYRSNLVPHLFCVSSNDRADD